MLTRRHIRIKVMQSLYALHQDEKFNLKKEETFLKTSCENTHNLYATMFSFLVALHLRGKLLSENEKNKFIQNKQDNLKNIAFAENKLLKVISRNEKLFNFLEEKNIINWQTFDDFVHIIYKEILQNEDFLHYTQKETKTWNDDVQIIVSIYQKVIAENDKLYDFLQSETLTWTDDIPVINTLIVNLLKFCKEISQEDNYFVLPLFKNKDDANFGVELLHKYVNNDEKNQEYLQQNIDARWDISRINQLDAIIIKMGITELLKFPSIPVKVTLNEYLEIAKDYSSPKSSVFVNGILNKISKIFEENKLLNKTGRGLL